MNRTVLTIEIPELSDELAICIQNMLYAMMDTFDTQYCHQIERYYRMERYRRCSPSATGFSRPNDNDDPF
jgi:hypothetical protein